MQANNQQKKKYTEYKKMDFPAFEAEILKFWKENDTFKNSVKLREGHPDFIFYEGPPSANGKPGIHHVMSRAIKDIFCRYKTITGHKVNRKAGWDTHGLPVELQVEKALGITKEDIGKTISIEEYNKACREDVMKYTDIWNNLTEKIGYWVDLDHPYITYENKYIETVWYLLKQLHSKNLLYKGFTIQPYSPAAGTGLSSHELNQPGTYKSLKDTSAVAMFKAKSNKYNWADNTYFIAWTTTPWTLPSNTALAVGKKIEYVKVKTYNPYTFLPVEVILAKDLLGKYFNEKANEISLEDYKPGDKLIPFELKESYTGTDLEGMTYEQLLPYAQPEDGDAFRVILGDFVTLEDGTGIVHIAPSFGADDNRVAKINGIGSLTLVDKRGKFTSEVSDFAGEYVKEQYLTDDQKEAERVKQNRDKYLTVDERISIKLKEENKAFKVEKYEHNYPHCWRTDKPILYYPMDSWFVKTTAYKDKLIAFNKTINWKPASTGIGRFGDWLNNLVDWNLSRSRYWGTPLPIWRSEDCTEEICIGSIDELKQQIELSIKKGFMTTSPILDEKTMDLHRPYVDDIILVSASGKKMLRETDLIDVWFDSGAMPYAQWGLDNTKLKNGEKNPFNDGWENAYPADYIAEGVDQTRGWFFTLHVLGVMLFDSVAYKNVIANGLVLDKNGNKMSKRLGNVVDPFETISKYGADATRWYMISNSDPWDNLKFDLNGISEVQRKLFATLYNIYNFYAVYANIDGFVANEKETVSIEKRSELDRWILSKLNSLIKEVTENLENYNPTPAARAIEDFVDNQLSNWYVRLSRRVFWKGEMNDEKKAAYETLYECLLVVSQLMSSFSPFFSDWMYKNLSEPIKENAKQNNTRLQFDSIHHSYLTKVNETLINKELELQMELAQQLSSMVFSLRKKVNIKVRQPLQRILVPISDADFEMRLQKVKSLVLAEVNVKELEFLTDEKLHLIKKVKPDFKLLGPKVGGKMKDVQKAFTELSQDDIRNFERNGSFDLNAGGEIFAISLNEANIITDEIPGWQVAVEGQLTVALDTTISEELEKEGIAREFVNRIQNLRKESGLEVTEKIIVHVNAELNIKNAIELYNSYICAEILASGIVWDAEILDGKEIDVNEKLLTVKIESSKK